MTEALLPKTNEDHFTKELLSKYIEDIPNIESKYLLNQRFSDFISRLYGKRISIFPLYKININIDRNPIKIPWTLRNHENLNENYSNVKKYIVNNN